MNTRLFDLEDITPWGQSRYDRLIQLLNDCMSDEDCKKAIEILDNLIDDIFENFHNKGGEE